jgi:hypothetical protein
MLKDITVPINPKRSFLNLSRQYKEYPKVNGTAISIKAAK